VNRIQLTAAALVLSAAVSFPLAAAPRPYHLELEATPAAPFPFLSKFGKVTLHVYPAGVRAETFWLNGFSRNGMRSVTVENPLGRMYTDVPITEIGSILHKLSTSGVAAMAPTTGPVIGGKVHGIDAYRHRLVYGPQAWIDVWTTNAIGDSPQLRTIVQEFVRGLNPATAEAMKSIPGVPLYVELNFRRYRKLPLLRVKELTFDASGEADALKVGTLYFKAPLLDSIWK